MENYPPLTPPSTGGGGLRTKPVMVLHGYRVAINQAVSPPVEGGVRGGSGTKFTFDSPSCSF